MLPVQKLLLSVAVGTLGFIAYLLWSKRRDEQDELSVPRCQTAGAVVARQAQLEVQIPSAAVGRLIGRQGSNIKKLEQVSGARLHMKRDAENRDGAAEREGGANMRVLLISGEPASVQLAEVLVRRELASEPEQVTEVVSVPQRSVRHIIGPGGEVINSISLATNARIKIGMRSRDPNAVVNVTVSGEKAKVDAAKEEILSIVRGCTTTGDGEKAFAVNGAGSFGTPPPDIPAATTMPQVPTVSDATAEGALDAGAANDWNVGRTIARLSWPDHDSYTLVFISSCVNPAHFWVHMLELYDGSAKNIRALDELRSSMTAFYSEQSYQSSPPDNASDGTVHQLTSSCKKGDVVAALFPVDGHWYRAVVEESLSDGLVDVTFFDYGDGALVESSSVKPLRADFWQLPQQAVECYAADLEPCDGVWTDEATQYFESIASVSQWKPVNARRLYSVSEPGGRVIPCIELTDTNGSEDINIANELIKKGFAKRKS